MVVSDSFARAQYSHQNVLQEVTLLDIVPLSPAVESLSSGSKFQYGSLDSQVQVRKFPPFLTTSELHSRLAQDQEDSCGPHIEGTTSAIH